MEGQPALLAIPNSHVGRALAVPNQCGSPGCTQHSADVSVTSGHQIDAGNHSPRPKTIPQHFTLVTVHSLPPPVSADSACRCARTYPPVSAPHPLRSCWAASIASHNLIHQSPFPPQLLASRLPGGATVSEACADVASQVRENVRLRRAFLVQGPPGGWAI